MTDEPDGRQSLSVLLVDDRPANLDVLRQLLESEGYRVYVALDGESALKRTVRVLPDLIFLDVLMPGMDGFEVCRRLKQEPRTAAIPVIFLTASDRPAGVETGFEAGGVDYITKPFREKEVLARLRTHLSLSRLTRELAAKNVELLQKNRELEAEIAQRQKLRNQLSMISQREARRWGLERLIGQSPSMQQIQREIRLMQENVAPSVLITGESGTGKELIARAIHFGSSRSTGPFVPVNCAAIPGELAESLFFGHARGAFTGADREQSGYFELADGGTLFLDEVGDMSLNLQGKLLRVLDDGQVQRVGEKRALDVDVRVLSATNTDLQERLETGRFRQDLYYRLTRFTVAAPPLRQRREDIPLLATHFLQVFAGEMGRQPPPLEAEVLEALQKYDFPGNVRELKNLIERALIESAGRAIHPHHLHFTRQPGKEPAVAAATPAPEEEIPLDLEAAELWLMQRALRLAGGNIAEAARLLGASRGKVYRVLARAGLESGS